MNELLTVAGASLRKAAMNEKAKNYILHDKVLFRTLKKAANRYIGGEDLEEMVAKVVMQNKKGYRCAIEFMGENTHTFAEARQATAEFLKACDCIKTEQLNAGLSLDLSHIGLSISEVLCLENLYQICSAAVNEGIEVTISAEGTDKTDAVLNTYLQASKTFGNLSITLQAYLHRTKDDLQEVIKRRGRIRLVKGAFATSPELSMPRGTALNERYLEFLDYLLMIDHKCSIATHDVHIQEQAQQLIRLHQTELHQYEFESLYGIQNDQLAALKERGHPAKMYFVYGRQWYLYLCNRIAEHPLNLFTALNDIVNG